MSSEIVGEQRLKNNEDTFVLIVGGGPVGLSLAADLGLRGVPTILLNDNTETAVNPKCNYSNGRTMEHFRSLGIADEVRASGLGSDVPRVVSFRTRFTEYELGRIELTFLGKETWPGPEHPHNINQLYLEPILKRRAESFTGVDVRFGCKVTSLEQLPDGVEVTYEDTVTGSIGHVKASYVVGCDGSRSLVRQVIGANLVGDDGSIVRQFISGTMISYFIRAPKLFEEARAGRAMMTWIINHDARGFVFSQNGNDRFIVHYAVPGGVDWQTVDAQDVLARMLGTGLEYEILSSGPWTGGLALVADKYSSGRMFIAGDASHLFTPLGGFGMNTGIGDAMNIGWKLAGVYKGWAQPALLESYAIERHPIGVRNSKIGVHCARRKDDWKIPFNVNEDSEPAEASRAQFGSFIVEDDRDEYVTIGLQLGERYESPIIVDTTEDRPADPWDVYIPSDRAGGRAPHFYLDDGRSLYDAVGLDYALLAFEGINTEALQHAAAIKKVPLNVVRQAAMDPQYQKKLVLIRPDGHIAWSSNAVPDDADGLIDQVRGAA